MRAKTIILLPVTAALLLGVAACTGHPTPGTHTTALPSPTVASHRPAAASPTTDPYATYLRLAPSGAPHLSRQDAQARAYLGCGTTWAPGTVDAALATAYRPTGICDGN